MKEYFRLIIYYSLELISSFINFVCGFFHYYPSVQLGISLLVFLEARRISSEKDERSTIRQQKTIEANSLKEKAKADE